MHGKPESGVLRCFHQVCSERLKRSEIVQRAKFFWHADTGPGGPGLLARSVPSAFARYYAEALRELEE